MTDVFCKIIAGEIPSERLIETQDVIVIRDIAPKAPVHLLVVPRNHIGSVNEASDEDCQLLGGMILAARSAAKLAGIEEGYKLVLNVGVKGGQEVPHIHLHVLGGWEGHAPSQLTA